MPTTDARYIKTAVYFKKSKPCRAVGRPQSVHQGEPRSPASATRNSLRGFTLSLAPPSHPLHTHTCTHARTHTCTQACWREELDSHIWPFPLVSQEQPGEQRGPCSGHRETGVGRAELAPAAPRSPAPGAQPVPSLPPTTSWRQKARIYRPRQGLVSELGTVPSESSRSRTSARIRSVDLFAPSPRRPLPHRLQRGQTADGGRGRV